MNTSCFQQDFILHAIDWDGPIPSDTHDLVNVPTTTLPICEEDYQDMVDFIDPMAYSSEHGIDIYVRCLSFVQALVSIH